MLKFRTRGGKFHGAVALESGRYGVYFRRERKVWGTVKVTTEYLVADMVNGRFVIRPRGAERVITGEIVDVAS